MSVLRNYSKTDWRRQWHPTPVLLPGKSHGWRSLMAAVHGITNSQTRLGDCTFTFHFHALEKEMATHSSVLAWRIPRTGEPGGLPSMGSYRVGHDWSDLVAIAAAAKQTKMSYSVGTYILMLMKLGEWSQLIFEIILVISNLLMWPPITKTTQMRNY